MTKRRAAAIAWTLWAIAVVATCAGTYLAAKYPFTSSQETQDSAAEFVWSASWFGVGLVGALIVSQRPRNRIGWVLVGITFTLAMNVVATSYGRAAFFDPAAGLPLGHVATWFATWGFNLVAALVVAVLLLFPSGELPVRRQKVLAWLLAGLAVAAIAVDAFTPGPVEGEGPPLNPLGLTRLAGGLDAAGTVLGMAQVVVAIAVLADFVYRFWRSRGLQRQQFRWMVLAAAAFPVLFVGAILVESAFLTNDAFDPVVAVFFVCGNGMAAAIGVAVSRHGLYEMSRVVSRSLGYAVLTAVLVATYLGAVTVLTWAIAPNSDDSPLAVAAATLLAAAVFGPARRRIQGVVDRRFDRARYDAGQTVERYRHRLREQVDVDALTRDLLGTVSASMHPAGALLLLRGGGSGQQSFLAASAAVTVPERTHETRGM